MARAEETKLYRTFVKGLITEASPLTFPEDASFDELNTVLSRKGNRTRRLGLNYATEEVNFSIPVPASDFARNEFVWKSVNENPDINYLIVQQGNLLQAFDLSSASPATGFIGSTDLTPYLRPGADLSSLTSKFAQFASGRGNLYVVHEDLEPLAVTWSESTETFTVTALKILIRDFEGMDDNLANDEEPAILSKEHHYNLQNQGWVTTSQSATQFSPVVLNGYTYTSEFSYPDFWTYGSSVAYQAPVGSNPIFVYQSKIGRFPGNNKQWWVARAEADNDEENVKAGDFLPLVLNKLYSGNNRAPRGHYVINAFRKDRAGVSGISDISIEDLNFRPNAVSFFSGRAWYAAGSTVYYSQILDGTSLDRAGLCHQEADPTAEDISDLIASDGGVVPIPEANKIQRILPLSNGMMVFALNGVWFVSGGDAAFSATNISVAKVSSIGTNAPLSVVELNDTIFWWSEVGINGLQQSQGSFSNVTGQFSNTNIAEQTIQSFYNEIPANSFPYVKGCYDSRNNVMYWLYQDSDTLQGNFRYNKVLLYDATLQAFYPWEFSMFDAEDLGPRVTGLFLNVGFLSDTDQELVTDLGVLVTDVGAPVTVEIFDTQIRPTNITYVTDIFTGGEGFTFSQADSLTYADWAEHDGTGLPYDSFLYTGFEMNNDAMRRKQAVYLTTHFRRTEEMDGEGIESTCTFVAAWDWSNNGFSNKWSAPIEAYRLRANNIPYFDTVVSKHKVRGSGKALQFRFGTSEIGKTFDLLGWGVAFVGNTKS